MSEERGDTTYKPKRQREKQQPSSQSRRPVRETRRHTDYSEVQLISDTDEESESVVDLGAGDLDINEDTDSLDTISVRSEFWTPKTFFEKTDKLLRGITEYTEQTALFAMAKQPEASMASVLQLMMQMRADDKEAEQKREDRRIERETQSQLERDRLERQRE